MSLRLKLNSFTQKSLSIYIFIDLYKNISSNTLNPSLINFPLLCTWRRCLISTHLLLISSLFVACNPHLPKTFNINLKQSKENIEKSKEKKEDEM